ncbi:MAG: hypothetical protein AAF449_25010, partial [Myxococcota bacterium]
QAVKARVRAVALNRIGIARLVNVDPGEHPLIVCADVDASEAEAVLARLIEDREAEVRIAAAERMAQRLKYVESAGTAVLESVLKRERRELVLPAALGLAHRQHAEAFQPLMLVFKAGLPEERERAVVGLGTLGDPRALEELYRLVNPDIDLIDEDRALAPAAAEALGAVLPALADVEARGKARQALDGLAVDAAVDIRIGALAGLRRVGDDASRGRLEALVADGYESIEVRRAAIREVSELGAAASETVLAEALNASDRRLRHDALSALKRILPDARTKVSLFALQSRYDDIAQPAALFLARHGDPETLVGRIAEIRDHRVRRRVRQGLIRRRAYASNALPALLSADRAEPRAEAAWLAGASGDRALAPAVLSAVKLAQDAWHQKRRDLAASAELHAEEEAWLAGLWAARRMKIDAAVLARAALGTETDAPARVQTEALRYLKDNGRVDDASTVEPLLSASRPQVRKAAAAAMARLAPERSAAVLGATSVADPAAVAPLVEAAWPTRGRQLL